MKREQIKFVGTLLAAFIMMSAAQGDLLIRDEFNTAVSADPANGIYQSGADLGDPANASVTGGTMVGFGTDAWSRSTFIEAYAGVMRIKATQYSWTYSGRAITTSMAGKTEAYGKMTIRQKLDAASASSGYVLAGFTSSDTLGSLGGAVIGYSWDNDNSHWDMVLRYRNTSDSFVETTLVEQVGDGIQEIYFSMDDTADTLNVWVDNANYNTVADLTVTDWGATVEDISHVSAGEFESGLSYTNFVYVYDMALGDTAEDIGMVPEPATVGLFGVATLVVLLCRRLRIK